MKTPTHIRPFLKWAGGKRQLLPQLRRHIPETFERYYEPFIGSGALFLALQRNRVVINDSNADLINCYQVVENSVEELICALGQHRNIAEHYYAVRSWDRSPHYLNRSPIERAARIIYLNKTCYNGLFRVNSHGHFNVPFGRYTNPKFFDEDVLRAVSRYMNENEVELRNTDFETAVVDAQRNDFVYFDPPYDPISDTASFTGYDVNKFGKAEQNRLKVVVDDLTQRGCKVLLSNAYTPFIVDLYREYRQVQVEATRAINSNAQRRGKIHEILVMNYDE